MLPSALLDGNVELDRCLVWKVRQKQGNCFFPAIFSNSKPNSRQWINSVRPYSTHILISCRICCSWIIYQHINQETKFERLQRGHIQQCEVWVELAKNPYTDSVGSKLINGAQPIIRIAGARLIRADLQ